MTGSARRGVLALALLVVGCRPADGPDDPDASLRAAQEAWRANAARYVEEAEPCAPVERLDTTGWPAATVGGRPLPFRLPPGFSEDTTVLFTHGGVRWTDGERDLMISRGYWGPSSFGSDATRCRTRLGGRDGLLLALPPDNEGWRFAFWLNRVDEPGAWDDFTTLYRGTVPDTSYMGLFVTMAEGAVASGSFEPPGPGAWSR
jgi:hypothetical protein